MHLNEPTNNNNNINSNNNNNNNGIESTESVASNHEASIKSNAESVIEEEIEDFVVTTSEKNSPIRPMMNNINNNNSSRQTEHSYLQAAMNELKESNFNDFNPMTTNAELWLNEFESIMRRYNTLHESLSFVCKFLDIYGLKFYRQVINPDLTWTQFKDKFKRYFSSFKQTKTEEALSFHFDGDNLEEYIEKKIVELGYAFPMFDEPTLRTMAISGMKNSISNNNQNTSTSKPNFKIDSMDFTSRPAASFTRASSVSNLDDSNLESNSFQSFNSANRMSRSSRRDVNYKVRTYSPDKMENDTSYQPTNFSDPSSNKQHLIDLIANWLKCNYAWSNNRDHLIRKEEIYNKIIIFFENQLSKGHIQNLVPLSMEIAFGQKPITIRKTGKHIVFFGHLRSLNPSSDDQSTTFNEPVRSFSSINESIIKLSTNGSIGSSLLSNTNNGGIQSDSRNVSSSDLVKQWLVENYIPTNDEKDVIYCQVLNDRLNQYLKSLNKKTKSNLETKHKLKEVFQGTLPRFVADDSPDGAHYCGLKEKAFKDTIQLNKKKTPAKETAHKVLCTWLKENYRKSNASQIVSSQKLNHDLTIHFKSLGIEPLVASEVGKYIKAIFGSRVKLIKKNNSRYYTYMEMTNGQSNGSTLLNHNKTANDMEIDPEMNNARNDVNYEGVICEWLKNNYEKTDNIEHKVITKNLFNEVYVYLNRNNLGYVHKSQIGKMITKTFGSLPYRRLKNQGVSFYSNLLKKAQSNQNPEQSDETRRLIRNQIVIDYLIGNYEKTDDENDVIECGKMKLNLNEHLKKLNEQPVDSSLLHHCLNDHEIVMKTINGIEVNCYSKLKEISQSNKDEIDQNNDFFEMGIQTECEVELTEYAQ